MHIYQNIEVLIGVVFTYIQLAKDLQELTIHGSKAFPVALYERVMHLERFDFVPLHWHKELQFVYIKSGCVQYRVGAELLILEEGEGLFINTSILHEAKPYQMAQATTYCINVDTTLLAGYQGSVLAEKYVRPYVEGNVVPYIQLAGKEAKRIEEVAKQLEQQADFFELRVWQDLLGLWQTLLATAMLKVTMEPSVQVVQQERAKEMLDYIHAHYQEKMTLEQLAAHVFLSRAECSRFFKKVVGVTPFTYLLHYRLHTSMTLLKNSEESITAIASVTGFSTVSYYIEKFKAYTGYSPSAYRKRFL
ncbi:AraC family transcriptional regulator [Lysinibacillus piscis]|uniref:HTH-type transcriptional regulator YdeC n=1 Tax=Lysinibacillus piscis TaxID=2518931 RepID=A0ABQ5NME6_9BACI|nr:AraC family transcriptional regulator [Lysinibacillus sp. KH24]GLC89287.1 putative HTH-type transcriptional regulator YdeC [Lysinibacillus sp. KH24]